MSVAPPEVLAIAHSLEQARLFLEQYEEVRKRMMAEYRSIPGVEATGLRVALPKQSDQFLGLEHDALRQLVLFARSTFAINGVQAKISSGDIPEEYRPSHHPDSCDAGTGDCLRVIEAWQSLEGKFGGQAGKMIAWQAAATHLCDLLWLRQKPDSAHRSPPRVVEQKSGLVLQVPAYLDDISLRFGGGAHYRWSSMETLMKFASTLEVIADWQENDAPGNPGNLPAGLAESFRRSSDQWYRRVLLGDRVTLIDAGQGRLVEATPRKEFVAVKLSPAMGCRLQEFLGVILPPEEDAAAA